MPKITAKNFSNNLLDPDILELIGDECIPTDLSKDRRSILKIRAAKIDIFQPNYNKYPIHLIGFTALPRPGAEELDIFLCRYTDEDSWIAQSWCKTQFAQLPKYGGTANFILAHIMIVTLLDKAQYLGILEQVFDESRYWDNRNPHLLINTGEDWNVIQREIQEILRLNKTN